MQGWIAVPEIPTEAQFWVGAKALRLPMKGVRVDPDGNQYPALTGPNRPGFVVQYAAMVAAAPPAEIPAPAPAGFRWVPDKPNDAQWHAAVDGLRLVKAARNKMLASAHDRRRTVAMYRAMNAAGAVRPKT